MGTIWGYERVRWVDTWVNNGNDDMSKHETVQSGCRRHSGSSTPITMDETWIHHYTPESKQQSKQWTEAGCSEPKKTWSVPSVGKVGVLGCLRHFVY